jgi:hypothetical protein
VKRGQEENTPAFRVRRWDMDDSDSHCQDSWSIHRGLSSRKLASKSVLLACSSSCCSFGIDYSDNAYVVFRLPNDMTMVKNEKLTVILNIDKNNIREETQKIL